MVNSMTGYGRNVVHVNNTDISVEIRTVNHRFLDISTKIPRSLLVMEEQMKKVIQSFFHRGRVDIFVNIEGEGLIQRKLIVNWELMDQYITSLQEIKEKYHLNGDIPIEMVTKIEDLFTIQENEQEHDYMYDAILSAVESSSKQVAEMRSKEGQELVKDLVSRIEIIQNIVKQLGERRDIVIIEYRERIKARIEEYLNEDLTGDKFKLNQEVAMLAEKGDVTEEVTRLNSHISQFLKTISQKGPIGRKLDFILQEMHRETNTIGSKSNDVLISEWVVTLKSEIEKIKEQVQNVE
ncbi:YicC family protein [Aquibacillus halophilus]|uniref:YicC family protein n=1 Tax=Aquibacillus halophilus TaxID=930132 RepID=A0A6A8D8X5_9BACI|nr:YicC/YloC family endoribonuclease [Aquibacillus halophilus]MRH42203.1 YicC family protein [Aquibacillus halophilus]